jgi:hypothetical protein
MAAAVGGANNPRLLYIALLFALCATPVLYARKLNDRYALYTIFLAIYFVSFGMLDVIHLVESSSNEGNTPLLDAAEVLILLSGAAFLLGYHTAANLMRRRGVSQFAADDWPIPTLLTVGIMLWAAGTFATWYWNIRLTVRSLEVNFAGSGVTTLLMLGRYAQPLGILVLAYAYTTSRNRSLAILIVAIVVLQVVLGFVSNTKSGAMLGGILVIVTSYLVKGRVPKAWLFTGIIFVTFAFPVFVAYRAVVVDEQGVTNAQAAQNIVQVVGKAIAGEKRAAADHFSSTFFERSSVKAAVEMIVQRVGVDVAYQRGHTLTPLVTAFIPRIFWPDKPDVQTGILLNEQFQIADAIVYISPSHLGELYWNFGWPGGISGMLILGLLLGWINSLCDLSTGTSVTRLLILAITIFETGVRFEGSIATEYEVWVRSVVGILILHALLARKRLRRVLTSIPEGGGSASSEALNPGVRFPNLMA